MHHFTHYHFISDTFNVFPSPKLYVLPRYVNKPRISSTESENTSTNCTRTLLQRMATGNLEEMLQEEPLDYGKTLPWDEQKWLLGPWYMKLVPWFKPWNQCVSSWLKTSIVGKKVTGKKETKKRNRKKSYRKKNYKKHKERNTKKSNRTKRNRKKVTGKK